MSGKPRKTIEQLQKSISVGTIDVMDDIIPPEPANLDKNAFSRKTSESAPEDEQPKQSKKSVPPHKRLKWIFFKPEHVSRKKWLLVNGLIVLLVAGGGLGSYYLYRYLTHVPKQTAAKLAPKEPPKPTTEPSRLTGVQVAPELNLRSVTGIMIENSPDARPQSGLKDAGVVFEAIAEGGITRFLALYQEAQPDYIGPIRSARPYYLDWLLPFDASLAHAGGSPEALQQIKSLGVKDLDQFANSGAYTRVTSRYAPHNVYSSIARLEESEKKKGYTGSTFTGFARKAEQPSTQPTAKSIDFNISAFLYNPHYDYDAVSNSYKRSLGGKPDVDEKSGAQISSKVVVALVMGYGIADDGKHSVYTTTGSGTVYVFQDGGVTQGTWQKADRKAQFVFTDAQGAPIKFNPGQTWLSVVHKAGGVTFSP